MKKLHRVVILFAAVCGCVSSEQFPVNPEAFFVPKDATHITKDPNGTRVRFVLSEPFPAERFLNDLRRHLSDAGWTEMDKLLVFPGRATSEYPGGWSEYLEGDEMVRLSARNWNGPQREAVTYIIRYAVKQGQSFELARNGRVEVTFMNSIEADELRSKLKD